MFKSEDYIIKKMKNNSYAITRKGSSFWMTVNEVGLRIINLLFECKETNEICITLSEKYQIPKDIISKDVDNFLLSLHERLKMAANVTEKEISCHNSTDNNKMMTIHITNRCNLNCPYCYKDANTNIVELTKDDITNLVKASYKIGFKTFVFSGGEPTIRDDFFELIPNLHDLLPECKFNLITNGTTELDDDKINIITSYINTMQISLDSSNEEINMKTRGSGSLEKVEKFAEKLLKNNYNSFYFASVPYTSNMQINESINSMPNLLRFAAGAGAQGIYVNMLKPNGRMDIEEYKKYNIDEYWEIIDKTYDELNRLYHLGFKSLNLFAASDYKQILVEYKHSDCCGAGTTELSIDNDGNTYPCPSLMTKEFLLGNIHEESIDKIYSKSYDLYSKISVDNIESCKECPDRYICGGGCRSLAYSMSGDIRGANPHCNQAKKRIALWQEIALQL